MHVSNIRLLVLHCALTSKDDGLRKRSNKIIFVRASNERLIKIMLETVLHQIKKRMKRLRLIKFSITSLEVFDHHFICKCSGV